MTRSLPAAPPRGDRSRRIGAADALLVLLGAQLLAVVWAVAVVGLRHGLDDIPDDLPIVTGVLANIGLWIGYGAGATLISRWRGRGPRLDFRTSIESRDVPIGLAIGVATQLVLLPALYWPILRFVDGDPSEVARRLIDTVDGPIDWIILAVSVVVIAPLVEEYFYRGLVLRGLQSSWGTVAAVVVSSAIFALVHQQLLLLPGLFVFAVIAAVLTVRSDRLGPAWAMHVAFNATTVIVLAVASTAG